VILLMRFHRRWRGHTRWLCSDRPHSASRECEVVHISPRHLAAFVAELRAAPGARSTWCVGKIPKTAPSRA